MTGKLIVIEGIDSSGKTTQLELLKQSFQKEAIPFESVNFPQYETSFYGDAIARFLRGEFGSLGQVDPHLSSILYANDRGSVKNKMYSWLQAGKHILANRYTTSNMAHQAGRLPKKEQKQFIKWLEELEYKETGIPREDIVLFLDVPDTVVQDFMGNSDRRQSYRRNAKQDMVEKDAVYLKKSYETYQWLAKQFPHWVRIDCITDTGNLLSREVIHQKIKDVLAKKGVLL